MNKSAEKRFRKMLKDLKAAGYKELWVGSPNPFWRNAYDSMIFAVPSITCDYKTPLWEISRIYFPVSCGNGLRVADQRQLEINLPKSLQGKHDLSMV
jgi:hypothetical protein